MEGGGCKLGTTATKPMEKRNVSTLTSPIVDARGMETRRQSRKMNFRVTLETGPTYLLTSEVVVIAESGILPSSTPTGWLQSETQAVQINLTNLLNYYGLCHSISILSKEV